MTIDQATIDRYAEANVLMSGASGYLASGLQRTLAGSGCHLTGLSHRQDQPPRHDRIDGRRCLTGDVRRTETWMEALVGMDVVFHLAAQTSARVAARQPLEDIDANVTPMMALLEACRLGGFTPVVVFAGTVTVCGVPQTRPVNETHMECPVTLYDIHKLSAERLLRLYVERGIISGATLRLPNVYGPGAPSRAADRGVLNAMIQRAHSGTALTIYGAGKPVRDFLYIDDACSAFLQAGCVEAVASGRAYVLGTGVGTSIGDAVRLVAQRAEARTGVSVNVQYVSPPGAPAAIDMRDFVADATQFQQTAGWRAQVALSDGIDKTLEALT
ncbi:MAG: NAD-dependent epimerase/dehydratase family protein [Verrucomicrobia bacterium]|nr:NAD-dependent epimerase/dehydratase family protein [Verrucomicrobiota bacterium]